MRDHNFVRTASGLVVAVALSYGCVAQQPVPRAETPVVEAPPAAPSDAQQRADALIEDMRRKEAAYAKMERETPAPPAPRLEDFQRTAAPAVTPAEPTITPAAPIAVASAPSGPATFGGHDESWWKNEMRNAEVRRDDSVRRLQHAREQQAMASRQMDAAVKAGAIVFAHAQEAFNRATADVNALEATVRNDHAAVERLREDARRANVPPGWLRWP